MSDENMALVEKYNEEVVKDYEALRSKEDKTKKIKVAVDSFDIVRADFGLFRITVKKGSLPKCLNGRFSSVKQAQDSIKVYTSNKK